jgi:peptidoglycan/LPS O-acetylase OafA/YrhL
MERPERRLRALDGWRGVLACAVALFHLHASYPQARGSNVPNGFFCVDFFFVLSGFVLASKVVQIRSTLDGARFLLLRLGRLYPLHLFTFAVLIVYQLLLMLNGLRHANPVSTFQSPFDPHAIVISAVLPTLMFGASKYLGVAITGNQLIVVFVAATIAFSAFTYRVIEAPARAWTRRRAERMRISRRSAAPAAPAA